jgi:ATP-dependent DNA ligase
MSMGYLAFSSFKGSKSNQGRRLSTNVFDILWHNGNDLTVKPILERRGVLKRILKPAPGIRLGSYVKAEGKALFNLTKEKGMEGMLERIGDSERLGRWLAALG